MAFKTVKDYNDDRYKDLFILKNDGDYADVIFLYRSDQDVLVATAHYIKSNDYSGYIHCVDARNGCPACEKGIRTQTKLFIPLYDVNTQEIKFFDRSIKFEPQLQKDVFSTYPNPSEYVFRITRHGESGSMETYYTIQAIGTNTFITYDDIIASSGTDIMGLYDRVCKNVDPATLMTWLNNTNSSNSANHAVANMPEYKVTPRGGVAPTMAPPASPAVPTLDNVDVEDEIAEGTPDTDFVEELDDEDTVF